MDKVINNYEVVMVFSVANGEEPAKALKERFVDMITKDATIGKIDEWGTRRLAYPINDEPDGHYVLVEFSSTADFPAELDRVFRITDGTLRILIIRKADVA